MTMAVGTGQAWDGSERAENSVSSSEADDCVAQESEVSGSPMRCSQERPQNQNQSSKWWHGLESSAQAAETGGPRV